MHAPKVPAPLLKEIKAEHMVDDDVSKVEFCEDATEDALLAREESSQPVAAPSVSATKLKRAHVTGACGLLLLPARACILHMIICVCMCSIDRVRHSVAI
jgi:hypothetical protein